MEANGAEMWENNSGSEENGEQEAECEMEISPNGAKQWIPTATPEETPYTGQKFKTVDEGIEFYKAYAKAVGFDVRHGTMRKTRGGEVGIKYMVCSREGFKPTVKEKNSQKGVCTETKKRRRVSKRVGCKARIVLTRTPNVKGWRKYQENILYPDGQEMLRKTNAYIWWAKGVNTQADNEAQSLANQLWNEFYNCMGLVNGWQEKMNEMLTTLQQLKKEFHKSKLQTN
nr:protein FAR1-RELATED SEQUENCE 5-like [Ipomoea batatas]